MLAGLLSRSIFQSELLVAEDRFLDLYSDHSGYQALLVETDEDSAGGVLEEAFAEEGLDAVRSSDRLAGFLVVENTYLSTFQSIGGLGLLLGTLGLAVVMVRSVLERRGELALLGAIGFSQAAVGRLIFLENSFLLVFGVRHGYDGGAASDRAASCERRGRPALAALDPDPGSDRRPRPSRRRGSREHGAARPVAAQLATRLKAVRGNLASLRLW